METHVGWASVMKYDRNSKIKYLDCSTLFRCILVGRGERVGLGLELQEEIIEAMGRKRALTSTLDHEFWDDSMKYGTLVVEGLA
jgi:hypothetical protein